MKTRTATGKDIYTQELSKKALSQTRPRSASPSGAGTGASLFLALIHGAFQLQPTVLLHESSIEHSDLI